jgi:hypothetical protein
MIRALYCVIMSPQGAGYCGMAHEGTRGRMMASEARYDGTAPRQSMVALVAILASILVPALAQATLTVSGATGVSATIHTADEIRATMLRADGAQLVLEDEPIGRLELATPDPSLDLVPLDAQPVIDAIASVQGFTTDLHVHVYLLPAMPVAVASSFAQRDVIVLAPALARPADETVAYIVTHELGHVLCWAALDGRPARWQRYRDLRGLVEQTDPASLPHAERNREIVAEDFRALFGGPLATRSGTIENAALPHPASVPGLNDLLAGYLATPGASDRLQVSTVSPNPCREQARVELHLSAGADKSRGAVTTLEIFDVRGRLVRRLQDDGVSGGRATVTWDGSGRDGRRAASGLYLYRIRCGGDVGQGRLLLVDR